MVTDGRAERDEVVVRVPDDERQLTPRLGAQAMVDRRASVSELEEQRLDVIDFEPRRQQLLVGRLHSP